NWHYDEIYRLIHSLQPGCLISNNHHLSPLPGEDFQAFEKDLPGGNTTGFGGADVSALPLETCETMNDSWGFNITDKRYKSVKSLVQYLVKAAGYNANFLLYVGPMADGTIQPEFTDTLKALGRWMQANGETIYGTRGNVIPPKDWGVVTRKDKTVYLHILKKPEQPAYIFIPELKQKIVRAFLFNSKKEIKVKQQPEGTFIYLDGVTLNEVDTILQLELK
ncbi:MAG TPA: alpha-L-fucosidase, partial [Flavisolibacter sp.]|nr:alpha-L-fucosidase [Flavisolibacter sp.]